MSARGLAFGLLGVLAAALVAALPAAAKDGVEATPTTPVPPRTWPALLVAGSLSLLAFLAAGLVLRRRRSGAPASPSPV